MNKSIDFWIKWKKENKDAYFQLVIKSWVGGLLFGSIIMGMIK